MWVRGWAVRWEKLGEKDSVTHTHTHIHTHTNALDGTRKYKLLEDYRRFE